MDQDGTQEGYDIELTRRISDAVEVPIIASGGAGNLDHLVEVLEQGHASAVLASSIFHFGTYTIPQTKDYLAEKNIPVRKLSEVRSPQRILPYPSQPHLYLPLLNLPD